jgi:hypothetical protein
MGPLREGDAVDFEADVDNRSGKPQVSTIKRA